MGHADLSLPITLLEPLTDRELNAASIMARTIGMMGSVARNLGDYEAALQRHVETLELAREFGLLSQVVEQLLNVVDVLSLTGRSEEAAKGQPERAVELAALVHHHRATEYEFKVYAGDLLAKLQIRLPPDVYAAAVERGAALDPITVVAELPEECAE
jgi:hypothetical protein